MVASAGLTAESITAALEKHGGLRKPAAKELGCTPRTLQKWMGYYKEKGATFPESPYDTDRKTFLIQQSAAAHEAAPEGYKVKGVSTLYDGSGEVKAQWVKTSADEEKLALAREAALRAMCETMPRAEPVAAPTDWLDALCNLYTITDAHVGMHAWGKETGEDWDLAIAEKTLTGIFLQMIASAPPAKVGLVNQLGDFLHFDSQKPVTPAHGHLLDADSRYQKMVEVAVRILRRIVSAALAKHPEVVLIFSDDNHGPVGQTWLRIMFAALFENEPRVRVELSPSPFTVYQHGEVMLGFHHGHTVKNESLPLLLATLYPEMWGATTHRECHTGHLHHKHDREFPGMLVRRHSTLAAPDSYAHRNGFNSTQAARSITYHSKFGPVCEQTYVPDMLEAA